MKIITDEKEKLEEEIERIKKEVKKKNTDIFALEEDKTFYEEQLSMNSVKRSEIASYKIQISDLQNAYAELEKLYKDQQEKINRLTSQILLYGDDPQKALKDNADLLKKVAELQSLISNCPSVEELQKLRETNKRFEEINNKLEIVMAQKLRL